MSSNLSGEEAAWVRKLGARSLRDPHPFSEKEMEELMRLFHTVDQSSIMQLEWPQLFNIVLSFSQFFVAPPMMEQPGIQETRQRCILPVFTSEKMCEPYFEYVKNRELYFGEKKTTTGVEVAKIVCGLSHTESPEWDTYVSFDSFSNNPVTLKITSDVRRIFVETFKAIETQQFIERNGGELKFGFFEENGPEEIDFSSVELDIDGKKFPSVIKVEGKTHILLFLHRHMAYRGALERKGEMRQVQGHMVQRIVRNHPVAIACKEHEDETDSLQLISLEKHSLEKLEMLEKIRKD
jgi:hypothetical protein